MSANKENKIKFNLKNVHIALLTKNEDGTYTYAKPVALPSAVNLSMEPQGEASPFYADGIVYFRAVTNNGYSGDLEIALVTDWFRRHVLKEIKDVNGVFIERNDDVEPVYFAMLFEFEGDIKAIRHVLYNCMVSTRPTMESSTKEDTIEPGTETLTISADPREDGLVTAKTGRDVTGTVYQNWYKAVYIPAAEAEPDADEVESTEAQLSALTIGELTLTPEFAAGRKSYSTSTSNASDTLTATGANSATVEITINGTAHTSGQSATWDDGENIVVIKVSKTGLTTAVYTVVVVKAQG